MEKVLENSGVLFTKKTTVGRPGNIDDIPNVQLIEKDDGVLRQLLIVEKIVESSEVQSSEVHL